MTNPFRIFQKLPCDHCHSECCHHVVMHRDDITRIFEYLKTLDGAYVQKLRQMPRPPGMCPFVDTEKWQCSVYPARPSLCRLFGYSPKLKCSYAPQLAETLSASEAFEAILAPLVGVDREEVTIAGDLFTWDNIDIEFTEDEEG